MNTLNPFNIIPGLHATAPAREHRKELMLFGQFIGGWELEARWFLADGRTRAGRGAVHFGWILEGRAIQDIWSSRKGSRSIPAGTTVRYYDPKIDAWHCVWVSPRQNVLRTFGARKVGDEIVLQGTTSDGRAERWIFSDIIPGSFRWRAVEWSNEQKDWRLTEEMRATKLSPKRKPKLAR